MKISLVLILMSMVFTVSAQVVDVKVVKTSGTEMSAVKKAKLEKKLNKEINGSRKNVKK